MNIIKVLLIKELLIIKQGILKVSLFFFLLPLVLYLFLTIPLSAVVVDIKPIYMVWSAPGIWIVSALYLVYLFNFFLYERNFNSEMMMSIPIQPYQYLFFSYIFSLIIGVSQLVVSILIISSLNSDYLGFIKLLEIIFLIMPGILIISSLSCLISFFVKHRLIVLFTHIFIFLIICFGIGSFIPLDKFPADYFKIVQYVPITGIILNCQKIISNESVFFSFIFISFLYVLLFALLNLLLIDKSIEGNK